MKKSIPFLFLIFGLLSSAFSQVVPLKIGVAGLHHGHVGWVFEANERPDVEIVGIAEPNRELAERYAKQHGISMDIVFDSLEEMLEKTKPEAVTGFGATFHHLEIVQICAPRGIHVMVEKPLAVSLAHAQEMAQLARQHEIHLLTNYETSWYASNEKAYEILHSGQIGETRKVVVRDGHRGPKKIGVGSEFLEWLTDPELNGAGALMDFGCYGANLSTWLLDGQRPVSVTAVTQQLNPADNPKVDDEATIILTYPNSQTIIEASWNWPIGIKDLAIYGLTGAIFADDGSHLRVRMAEGYSGFSEEKMELLERSRPYDDPFSVLLAVVRRETQLGQFDPYSLENNLLVMEILQAAKESAETGKTVFLSKK
ncbi:Gfo/Idh/MocA family oxidoreductase [Algoriphagus aestuariicola]|uniref:Gfo/Idh/MocA family oxidoreductase n=1 Tax=Algoriphagus aestuariicola TaxID=1852016 RepID=A0ABS3BXX9_9BACT|nr:Gfo/Idh/MocA family oxidoreductase [Algoriphagus aestuariicola]MBN7803166.1 Gfo/Idh/MocA family oxidoreductase [Algoriphagus aestuariicola]